MTALPDMGARNGYRLGDPDSCESPDAREIVIAINALTRAVERRSAPKRPAPTARVVEQLGADEQAATWIDSGRDRWEHDADHELWEVFRSDVLIARYDDDDAKIAMFGPFTEVLDG